LRISPPDRPILPHEILFGAFLAITAIRLSIAVGPFASVTLVYVGFIAGAVAVALWCRARRTDMGWKMRLAYYPLAMNLIFMHMRISVPLIHPGHEDALLARWDAVIFGGNLSAALDPLLTRGLTEILALCYSLFFAYLAWALVRYLFRPLDEAVAFYSGLFGLYGIGFLGYTLVPALGPYTTLDFTRPLDGYVITHWLLSVCPLGTNGADVFPSLHVAVSAYILALDARFARRFFWRCLFPVLGLWLSTIALRFHYGIDVVAGFLLAAATILLAFCVHRSLGEARHALRPLAI
jgi:membrane-associated phospholipid phosphatase